MKKWGFVAVVVLFAAAFIPIPAETELMDSRESPSALDLSEFSDEAPGESFRLLFIHHSVGGQLLAPQGDLVRSDDSGAIYESHPNGGDLRARLVSAGYEVHELSYDSELGQHTDMFDWLPKFRDSMDQILRTDRQDTLYEGELRNQIVVFKSCFPQNLFKAEGSSPGDPAGPELTVWNARATLNALLEHFAAHPDVLFVYLTAPPIAPPTPSEPLWKWLARRVLGRMEYSEAVLARQLNDWVRSTDGWLAGYPHRNVVVFDYYDILTDHGESNMLRYVPNESTIRRFLIGGGLDSHPSAEGQQLVAEAFLPFLNRAVRRAGLIE